MHQSNDLLVRLLDRIVRELLSELGECEHDTNVIASAQMAEMSGGVYTAVCMSCGVRGYVDHNGGFHEGPA